MPHVTVGLMNTTSSIAADDVARVAAALDRQVKRDLGPIWSVEADVVTLPPGSTVPRGVAPIFIVDDTPGGFAGQHRFVKGVPWAIVSTKRDWALAASHECIELLVDPTGEATRNAIGIHLVDGHPADADERFEYLIEACDPIEDTDHAYLIDGIRVSDFYTPSYFDDAARPGVRYSFNGALTRPREVGRNGYLSWRDAGGGYRQLRNFNGYEIVELAAGDGTDANTRMFIDRNTPTPRTHPELFQPRRVLQR